MDYDWCADSARSFELWWEIQRVRREVALSRRIAALAEQVAAIARRVAQMRGET